MNTGSHDVPDPPKAAIRTGEQQLRALVLHALDGIVVTDEQGVIVEWNPAQERITGLQRAEVLGRPIWDVQYGLALPEERTPEAYDALQAMILGFLRTGWVPQANQLREREIVRPDGTRRTIQAVAFPVRTAAGYTVGSIVRDVTEVRQAEAERAQREAAEAVAERIRESNAQLVLSNLRAQELAQRAEQQLLRAEEAVRTRDAVLATVSHDLRNPLQSIKGWAQLLQRRVASREHLDADELNRGLEHIGSAAAQMASQIEELLAVAHHQAGRALALERAPVDLVDLAQRALDQYAQTGTQHRLQLETAVPSLVGHWDAARLERVLANLLSNAVKYCPGGGDVRLTVAREGEGEGAWAVLAVQDQGIGIPAADLPHIFEPFRRAPATSPSRPRAPA